MNSVSDKSFIDDTVDLDGKVFVRCTFERCILRFSGTAVFSTSDCTIDSSNQLALSGAAVTTIRQFRALLTYGGILTDAAKYWLFNADAESVLRH